MHFSSSAQQLTPEQLWDKGITAYQTQHYQEAETLFTQLTSADPKSAKAQFNLGNTFFKLKDLPKAILAYKRALLLDPSLHEAQNNLSLCKTMVEQALIQPDSVFFIQWWHQLTKPSLSNTWAIVALLFFAGLLFFFVKKFILKKHQPYFNQITLALCGLTCLTLLLAFSSLPKAPGLKEAVVICESCSLFNQPEKESVKIPLYGGTVVEIKTIKNGVAKVELEDGQTGFIDLQNIERVADK